MSTQQYPVTVDQQYEKFLQDAIDQYELAIGKMAREKEALRIIMDGVICTKCGEEWGEHRGHDAACPNPLRHKAGWKWPYFEGQFFSTKPTICTAVAVRNSQDTEGVPCREKAMPGKTMCEEHYTE
jgi:hypothetical protein